MRAAKYVIAVENETMPRVHGRGVIHVSQIDALVKADRPIYSHPPSQPDPDEQKMGDYIASQIRDGSCIQMGIGGVPNAVLASLKNHKHLGLHTELLTPGILPLLDSGVVDNSRKKVMPGRYVSWVSFGALSFGQLLYSRLLCFFPC